ncbi:MAG: geranylgeranylglycerol-phosphate geranylgeranyltransferase [Candidatus Edwardsbacteria bacterium]
MTPKIQASLEIIRPVNAFLAVVSVVIGSIIAGGKGTEPEVLRSAISVFFICGGGNILNDYFDFEIDKINRPNRPLPSGRLKKNSALALGILFFILGLLLSWWINYGAVGIAVVAVVLLVIYSAVLKRIGLPGNIIVALAASLPFIYGGVAIRRIVPVIIPTVFAFIYHFGREIIKDAEDIEGDLMAKARTLPIRWGIKKSVIFVLGIFCLLIILTPIPFFLKIYNWRYFAIVLLGVDLFLVFIFYWLFKDISKERLKRVGGLLKIDMFMGILALYLGRS